MFSYYFQLFHFEILNLFFDIFENNSVPPPQYIYTYMGMFCVSHWPLHSTFSFYSKVTLTMSVLRQNTNCVKDVNPQSENWILIARVIRLWFVSDQDNKVSILHGNGHTRQRCKILYHFLSYFFVLQFNVIFINHA